MWKSFLNLWLKFPCPLCHRTSEDVVCLYCQKKLGSCQLIKQNGFCAGDLPVFVWGRYEGELKRAIAALKYNNQPEIGVLLGKWLAKSWQEQNVVSRNEKLTVVPIPLHRTRLQRRGFNQASSIAKGFCHETGDVLEPNVLIREKATEAMFSLNPAQRKKNLQNSFTVSENWQKLSKFTSILLLDDIYTTGTTLKEAARVLRQQNIHILGSVVIATSSRSEI
ncbi:putative amidophosphoribosyltransferase [Xenococcus sp. PCC 7305]|uniref:ComF family protein n=1 Tax=Xenococcus sp. PCC 7305 TaxID=102125 RepID=UPI0002AC2359|nr:phosphoribosyltransferase family protein [Xenococcus sp. PCC 7305]ELS05065.1 putative amidophosphoribosyltransferase [Xenococcus sp. PCC 7305]